MILIGELATFDARIALEQRVGSVTSNGDDRAPVLDVDLHRARCVTNATERLLRLDHEPTVALGYE